MHGSRVASRSVRPSNVQPQRRHSARLHRSNSAPTTDTSGTRTSSHNRNLEAELQHLEADLQNGWADWQAGVSAPAGASGGSDNAKSYDVIGLGQAMVDVASKAPTSDEFLASLGVEKGARKLISVEDRAAILDSLGSEAYQISAGGSLSNTLMALARLSTAGEQRVGARSLRVAMAGLIGSDPLGAFYSSQMREAGVEVLSAPHEGANTGTVCVLTSPDAQRTMLSYLGSPAEVEVGAALEAAISRSRMLVVEGYLWELPGAEDTVTKAIRAAQRHGTVVAMTAGDAGVVERHHREMWRAVDAGIDLLFTNASEAAALLKHLPASREASAHEPCTPCPSDEASSSSSNSGGRFSSSAAQQAALALGPHCSMVCVTDGSRGSYITALGQLHVVPPVWMPQPPVDSCGAGDAYAAGFLYGLLQNFSITSMGRTAARTAAAVINVHGATLTPDAAASLADQLPTATPASFFESLTAQLQ